jgi:hypothetical protein
MLSTGDVLGMTVRKVTSLTDLHPRNCLKATDFGSLSGRPMAKGRRRSKDPLPHAAIKSFRVATLRMRCRSMRVDAAANPITAADALVSDLLWKSILRGFAPDEKPD